MKPTIFIRWRGSVYRESSKWHVANEELRGTICGRRITRYDERDLATDPPRARRCRACRAMQQRQRGK